MPQSVVIKGAADSGMAEGPGVPTRVASMNSRYLISFIISCSWVNMSNFWQDSKPVAVPSDVVEELPQVAPPAAPLAASQATLQTTVSPLDLLSCSL